MSNWNSVDELMQQIALRVGGMSASDSLKFLFTLDDKLYKLQGRESIRYGGGVHTKHRHTRYHDFFIDRVEVDSRVLDFGCGNGALTHDIAINAKPLEIFGIDLDASNIEFANKNFVSSNVNYVCGDALCSLPDKIFDIIVMSNVLEHIEYRIEILKGLSQRYRPRKILVRVPLFERDWRVPLKKELGLEWRLDDTHFIEYTVDEFENEIHSAGLRIFHQEIHWGEIWAEIRP